MHEGVKNIPYESECSISVDSKSIGSIKYSNSMGPIKYSDGINNFMKNNVFWINLLYLIYYSSQLVLSVHMSLEW